jgi:outer membrane protein insertion porin family
MRFGTALLFAAIALQAPAVAQQSSGEADKLASVRVTGSQRYHSDQIAAALGLRAGETITREDLQKAADKLAQLGLFADVQFRFASTPAGVLAEYQVKDAPALRVAFDNFPWFADAELLAAIQKAGVLCDGTAPEHGAVLDSITDALETLGVSRGLFAKVTHKVARDQANEAAVVEFDVEDSRATVSKVEFSHSLAQSDRGVQSRSPDLVGKPFSRSAIQLFEFEQVRPVYLSKGYLQVRFAPPEAQLVQGSNAKAQDVTVTAAIDPGPSFAFGGVVWSGNVALSRADLDKLLPLRPHDIADGMKIESLWQDVRDEYAKRGYLDADVEPHAVFDQAAKGAAYSVAINEGPQYHMGKLTLSGLSAEGEKRVRQAWKMPPGVVFDEKAYEDFLDNGTKQAFAGLPFHYDMIGRFLDKNPATSIVDVLLDFQ